MALAATTLRPRWLGVLGAISSLWLILLVTETARGAGSLAQQAEGIAKYTKAQAALLKPAWSAAERRVFAEAAERGVLAGTKQPLSDARVAELREAVSYLLQRQPDYFRTGVVARGCADYASWLIGEMLTRTPLSADENSRIGKDIEGLTQAVEQAVVRKGQSLAAAVRPYGVRYEAPREVAVHAAQWFRQQAVAARESAVNPLFKRPLSVPAIYEDIRRGGEAVHPEIISRLRYIGWQRAMLMFNDSTLTLDDAYRLEAALTAEWALNVVFLRTISLPEGVKASMQASLDAQQGLVQKRREGGNRDEYR